MKHFFFKFILLFLVPCYLLAQEEIDSCPPNHLELNTLEAQVRRDLIYINTPALQWLQFNPPTSTKDDILDVAIIGGGMAGMTTAFALIKEGITNIQIFDDCEQGKEGPWTKIARMKHLRSNKGIMGPALGVPSLTFHSWYETCYGKQAWCELNKIPTQLWAEYLRWYRRVLKLPVQNCMLLQSITPSDGCLELVFDCNGEACKVLVRKVVLATGRVGFGGGEVPEFAKQLPKQYYAHTNDHIDSKHLINKHVVVVGAGASAFDAAAMALESGAQSVRMLVRRDHIPTVYKFSYLSFPGMIHGFYHLSDDMHCKIFAEAIECGIPPPLEAVERIKDKSNLSVSFNIRIEQAFESNDSITLKTNYTDIVCDFMILATGYSVDGSQRPELKSFFDSILLWDEFVPKDILTTCSKLGHFPYLGSHFQFQEKIAGEAPYLKNIYCFNYGSYLSHGLISGDIPGISYGASRLAAGIAADFFIEDSDLYYQSIIDYDKSLFNPQEYQIFSN